MKKLINKEVIFCDRCNKEVEYSAECVSCGSEFCYDCSKKIGKTFSAGVFYSGSGDSYFCHTCIQNIPPEMTSLFAAYIRIQALRQEQKTMWEDFDKRRNNAEEELQQLLKKGTYHDKS